MSNQLSMHVGDVIHQIPTDFDRPAFLYAAGAIAMLGAGAELLKRHMDNRPASVPDAIPPADEGVALASQANLHRGRRIKTAIYGAGLLLTSLAVAQASGPHAETTDVHGNATVVIDVGYKADASASTAKDAPSRLQTSVEGAFDAAKDSPVAFTFVVDGSRAQIVDRTSANNKNLDRISQKLNKILTPTLRNGQGIAEGVEIGAPDVKSNSVIVLASELNDAEMYRLQTVKNNLKHNGKGDVYAIVVGQGAAKYQVGFEELTAGFSPRTFEAAVGKDNVFTANSDHAVKDHIKSIVDKTIVSHDRKPSNVFANLALLSGITEAALAARLRLTGLSKFLRKKEN